jgi:hypothetical protein
MSKSKFKIVVTVSVKGSVHSESFLQGCSVNQVSGKMKQERRNLWPERWVLQQDSSLAIAAVFVMEFLTLNPIILMERTTECPDLLPCDFFLVLTTKTSLKETHFGSSSVLQQAYVTRTENGTRRRVLEMLPNVRGMNCFVHICQM